MPCEGRRRFQQVDQLNELIAVTIISILSSFDDETKWTKSSVHVTCCHDFNFYLYAFSLECTSVQTWHSTAPSESWNSNFYYVKVDFLFVYKSLLTSQTSSLWKVFSVALIFQ